MNSILNGPISTICFGLIVDEPRLFFELVFFQAALHQRQRESGAVDRHVDFGEEIGNRADVVLVAVGQDQRPHVTPGAP